MASRSALGMQLKTFLSVCSVKDMCSSNICSWHVFLSQRFRCQETHKKSIFSCVNFPCRTSICDLFFVVYVFLPTVQGQWRTMLGTWSCLLKRVWSNHCIKPFETLLGVEWKQYFPTAGLSTQTEPNQKRWTPKRDRVPPPDVRPGAVWGHSIPRHVWSYPDTPWDWHITLTPGQSPQWR